MAASPLIRICGDRAHTLGELLEGLRRVSDSSIFTHTFHTVEKHHFLTEGFSNDFAHWVLAALNEHSLAEQLEALDIRQYPTLGQLRQDVISTIEKYLEENPTNKDRQAFEPFYFCESHILAVPSKLVADDLDTFVGCLLCVSLRSISYHFIESRLRSPTIFPGGSKPAWDLGSSPGALTPSISTPTLSKACGSQSSRQSIYGRKARLGYSRSHATAGGLRPCRRPGRDR